MTEVLNIKNLEDKLIRPETDLRYLTAEQQFQRIMSKVADLQEAVISPDDLLERLKRSKKTNKPLTVKFGIDPTGPDIHVGHAVSLINLRLFQRLGHKVILIIGDFTGMIGDPSGRIDDRPALTPEDVRRNMATYEEQASKIINLRDPSIERHYNSEWMNQLSMQQWVELTKQISVSSLLQREDFRLRLERGEGLSIAELEYAIFMGYDSVLLNPDIEIGGVDQYLNMHMCRQMMSNAGQKPEVIATYNLLAGTTGEQDEEGRLVKMSKSRGNYIAVTADPADMYGKVMSISDEVMWIWYRELTEITSEDLATLKTSVQKGDIHPKAAKQLLARVVVGTFNYFDPEIIRSAENDFNSKFGKQAVLVPEGIENVKIAPAETLVETLSRAINNSKGHIRRLVQQHGVRVLKKDKYIPLTLDELYLPADQWHKQIVNIGKRHYFKLTK